MEDIDLFQRLGLALGIGLLIGIERGWQFRGEVEGGRIAGARTFTLIGLLGGVWGLLALNVHVAILGAAFLGFSALLIAAYIFDLRRSDKPDIGITTEVGALLTFALGALAVLGDMVLAAAGAVVTVAVLDIKARMHGWIATVDKYELDAAIKLLLISVVLLPLLPDKGFGPGQVLNPYTIWWMVVLIAALSFLGYVAIKIAGPRLGSLMTGALGGLASSTATTLAFARLGAKQKNLEPVLATGIVIAAGITFLRILVIIGIVNPALLPNLAVPLGLMAAASAAVALFLGLRAHGKSEPPATELPNPSELRSAVVFGAFLAAILLLSHVVKQWIGEQGLYGLAAVSGLADVDAITLSMANMAETGLNARTASAAIVIAAISNLAVKGGLVAVIARGALARYVGLAFAAIAAAGVIGIFVR